MRCFKLLFGGLMLFACNIAAGQRSQSWSVGTSVGVGMSFSNAQRIVSANPLVFHDTKASQDVLPFGGTGIWLNCQVDERWSFKTSFYYQRIQFSYSQSRNSATAGSVFGPIFSVQSIERGAYQYEYKSQYLRVPLEVGFKTFTRRKLSPILGLGLQMSWEKAGAISETRMHSSRDVEVTWTNDDQHRQFTLTPAESIFYLAIPITQRLQIRCDYTRSIKTRTLTWRDANQPSLPTIGPQLGSGGGPITPAILPIDQNQTTSFSIGNFRTHQLILNLSYRLSN